MVLDDSERMQLREALHEINNALNSVSMQAELARMYADNGNTDGVREALEVIMQQCRRCSRTTQSTQGLLKGES